MAGMGNRIMSTLAVAAGVTLAVGLLSADGWPPYVIGAVLAMALWVIIAAGDAGSRPMVGVSTYAVAALVSVALGYVLFLVGGADNGSWWAPGFIIAGLLAPYGRKAAASAGRGDS
jgi:hypothetical protein